MLGIQFDSVHSMFCITTIDSQSNGVIIDDNFQFIDGDGDCDSDSNNNDGLIIAVSACQGKGAGPAEAVGKDIASTIFCEM